MQDSLAAALVTQRGVSGAVSRLGRRGLLLLDISGEADAAALGRRRVHELADRGEDGGDRRIVGGELLIEPCCELRESARQFFVRADNSRSCTKARTT